MTDNKLMPEHVYLSLWKLSEDTALLSIQDESKEGVTKYTRADLAAPTDAEVLDAANMLRQWKHEITCETFGQYVETLIRAATTQKQTDVPCRTCKGDPETCADVPDARRVYGFHSGKALSCHPPGVESAIEAFLRFNGAVFVDGKPVEKFGIATGAMSSAIQAYLDYYRNGVGDTDETRKSY